MVMWPMGNPSDYFLVNTRVNVLVATHACTPTHIHTLPLWSMGHHISNFQSMIRPCPMIHL